MNTFTFIISILCTIFLGITPLHAQQSGTASGTILENATPVRFANVLVFTAPNGKFAKGALTDSLGNFTIPSLVFGQYTLKIRRLGFKEKRVDVTLGASNSTLNLGTITLQNDTKVLDGVEVTANKEVVKKTAQGFIMKPESLSRIRKKLLL
jgi:CarboxypepD_reg-like domain